MGRELRLVTDQWEPHEDPLFDGMSFVEDVIEYYSRKALWERGIVRVYGEDYKFAPKKDRHVGMSFEKYYGSAPRVEYYTDCRPWMDVVGMVMYENTSEGTPISPMFPLEQREELAEWLADNNASAFGSMTATKEQWLATIEQGWAVSMVYSTGKGARSGVACNAEEAQ